MKKTIILFLIISFTIALLYALVMYMGVQGFLFAWVLNLLLMMCVFVFTETLKAAFKSDYYREKNWEQRGKIYESLGINYFRKLLVLVGWEKLNKKDNPVKNDKNALVHLEYRTKQSELGHLIIFFIVIGFTVYVATQYGFESSLWLLALNIILNVYPILLQRYNRPRLHRIINIITREN